MPLWTELELLEEEEQRLLARLAVFSGGCTLEAAEAVCDASLAALTSLADKSLLRRDETDEPRFRMLETIRDYALERLQARGEEEDLRRLHAEHFGRRARARSAAELRAGKSSGSIYGRLESDLDNIRAALGWADTNAPELMLELAGLLKLFWRVRGHLEEGRRWLDTALAHGSAATPGRARALEAAGALAQRRGDYASAKALWQEGLEIWRGLGDDEGVARALGDLASVYDLEGDADRAIPLYEESADLLRKLGLEYELGTVISNLGVCLMSQGRLDEAAQLYEEAVELCRASGRAEQLTISLFNLGRVSMLQGRHEAAAGWFERALETARELGYREMIAYCLKGIGEVLAARAAGEQAARLLGASDRLFLELGAHVESSEQATYEVTVEQLKDALGDDAYSSAHAEGKGMSLDQALALALGSTSSR